MKRFKDKLKIHLEEIIKTKTSSKSIALGIGIGTFISILPTPFLNILIGILILLIFKNISKISLFASMAFWNPLTLTPIYYLSYKIGGLIFGSLPVIKYNVIILDQIFNFSRRFLIGNLILAIIFSILFYIISYYITNKVQKNKSK